MSTRSLALTVAMLATLPTLVGCMGHAPLLNDEVELIESYGGSIGVGWSPYRVSFFDHVQPIPVDDDDFEKIIEALREFRNLQYLNMKETDIMDRSIPLIATLESLERVALTGTKVTREGVLKLQRSPKLELVTLSQDRFTEDDVHFMKARMPHVEFWREEESFPDEDADSESGIN